MVNRFASLQTKNNIEQNRNIFKQNNKNKNKDKLNRKKNNNGVEKKNRFMNKNMDNKIVKTNKRFDILTKNNFKDNRFKRNKYNDRRKIRTVITKKVLVEKEFNIKDEKFPSLNNKNKEDEIQISQDYGKIMELFKNKKVKKKKLKKKIILNNKYVNDIPYNPKPNNCALIHIPLIKYEKEVKYIYSHKLKNGEWVVEKKIYDEDDNFHGRLFDEIVEDYIYELEEEEFLEYMIEKEELEKEELELKEIENNINKENYNKIHNKYTYDIDAMKEGCINENLGKY